MTKEVARLHYEGSTFWLIFWCICYFPIALALLLTSSSFVLHTTRYRIQYNGSRFWFCFWLLLFFPITFLLACLNGFSLITEENERT
jgi:ABC-type multidrug transport system permease subunit